VNFFALRMAAMFSSAVVLLCVAVYLFVHYVVVPFYERFGTWPSWALFGWLGTTLVFWFLFSLDD